MAVSKDTRRMLIGLWLCTTIAAAPPPKIPGEDITDAAGAFSKIRDSAVLAPPPASPFSPTWLENAIKTWDAPPFPQQIEEDSKIIPVGKGAIFIPRFSDPALEPTIQIDDANGKLYAWGETGKKYLAVPGEYSVMLGSGTVSQRILKKVKVTEGSVTPVLPDWCGLSVDVVDESSLPFRGPYELARIDDFEAYGRSYGRDMARGERVKTWILKPGLYKIISAGGSYNTLNNFITVRLVPGEFVRVIIIENQVALKIIGGGVINTGAPSSHTQSAWKHNLGIGGTIMFNATKDRVESENTQNETDVAFLSLFDLAYKKGSSDWETNVFWQEGLKFSDLIFSDINYMNDEFRITSLYVWRVILSWLGPYCRTEFKTHFFPVYEQFGKNDPNHFFIILNSDTSVVEIDSKNKSKEAQPIFSPLTIEAGVGTNIDVITLDKYDAKLRAGMGYSQTNKWKQKYNWNPKYKSDTSNNKHLKIDPGSGIDSAQLHDALSGFYKILYQSTHIISRSYGPEFGLALNIRTSWLVARGDFRMRIPLDPLINQRLFRPDWDIITTLSWTLTRSISLDYIFSYTLQQPLIEAEHVHQSSHNIFLRFSISSR